MSHSEIWLNLLLPTIQKKRGIQYATL